jgi:hypothetical protein
MRSSALSQMRGRLAARAVASVFASMAIADLTQAQAPEKIAPAPTIGPVLEPAKPTVTPPTSGAAESWQDTLSGWAKGGMDKVAATVKSWAPAGSAEASKQEPPPAGGAEKQLEALGLQLMPDELSKLQSALKDNAFKQAEEHARKLDELLGSDSLKYCLEVLKLQATSGTDAAVAAMQKYIETPGLKSDARRVGEEILGVLKSVKRDDAVAIVSLVVYLSLESKMSHGAAPVAAMAGMVTEDLWTYIARIADEKGGGAQYQWDRSNLKAIGLGLLAVAQESVDPSERLARDVTPSMVDLVKSWSDAVAKGDAEACKQLFHPARRMEAALPQGWETRKSDHVESWNMDLLFHRGALVGLRVERGPLVSQPEGPYSQYYLMVLQRGVEHDSAWQLWDVMPWAGSELPRR